MHTELIQELGQAMPMQTTLQTTLQTALLTVEQMAQADHLSTTAIHGRISMLTLMDNAGKAVAREIVQRWDVRPVVVLCGPGNNGGDGFVTALALVQIGWPVRVALLTTREQLSGAARHYADLWHGDIAPLTPAALDGAALVVDAIFGAGLSRAIDGAAAQTLAAAAAQELPIIAIDVPSGLLGDTGEALGAIGATLTVTFFRKKPGHVLLPGRLLCGELVLADIGTPVSVLAHITPTVFENDPALWQAALPQLQSSGNKYTRGHALISGGYPMTGAARLAARAAARMGAGLTTIAVPEIAFNVYAAALTSIMVHPLAAPADFDALLADARFSGLLIGPGAGLGTETRARVLAMLTAARPTLLDADAISVFKDDPELLLRSIVGACVMTPHEGEFSRIFKVTGDKLTRARTATLQMNQMAFQGHGSAGAVLVLKGADTIIVAPDGTAIINSNAPPSLATAGAGDVLSGIILGLLTQGMPPFLAAAAGVWLHGAAASAFGPGLIAEDLPDLLPAVLRRFA